jgi:hypothetical protein
MVEELRLGSIVAWSCLVLWHGKDSPGANDNTAMAALLWQDCCAVKVRREHETLLHNDCGGTSSPWYVRM